MVVLEVCVDSVDSARAALEGGAHRVELCSALSEGGITPSQGLISRVMARVGSAMNVHVLIRPRAGDFLYNEEEMEVMVEDIRVCKQFGVHGVVIGCLNADGDVDESQTRQLMEVARPMSVTFHRCFDMTRNAKDAMRSIMGLGVDRLLTSGHQNAAVDGITELSELVEQAGDRLVVMAGAGVNKENVAEIVAKAKVKEVHASARAVVHSGMKHKNLGCFMGSATHEDAEYVRKSCHPDVVRGITAAL